MRRKVALLAIAASLATLGLLSGCASNETSSSFGEVTLRPGDSKNCVTAPCTILFVMPEGTGTYTLTEGGGFKLGDYPAGETVNLGAYYTSTAFQVVGADVPTARVFISGRW